jgi:hypothetical protein
MVCKINYAQLPQNLSTVNPRFNKVIRVKGCPLDPKFVESNFF